MTNITGSRPLEKKMHPSERKLKVVHCNIACARIPERPSFADFNIHHVITFLFEKRFAFVKITIILQMWGFIFS